MGSLYPLVESFFVVSFKSEGKLLVPYNKLVYPPNSLNANANVIPDFCFPDITKVIKRQDILYNECYIFTTTLSDNSKKFGVCKRLYPNNYAIQTSDSLAKPACLCLLSELPWFEVLSRLMKIVEAKFLSAVETKSMDLYELYALLDACNTTYPYNDSSLEVTIKPSNNPFIYYTFPKPKRPYPYGYTSFSNLLKSLSVDTIADLFIHLVRERRILFYSDNLEILTSSIFAAMSLLGKFQWQHILIPLLPEKFINYCAAPMPFIIGAHSSMMESIENLPLERIVFVDLDNKQIHYDSDDQEEVWPKVAQEDFKKAFSRFRAKCYLKGGVHDGEILMYIDRFWNEILPNHVKFFDKSDGQIVFYKEDYILASPRFLRNFLGYFCSSQMFDQFIFEQEFLLKSGFAQSRLLKLDGFKHQSIICRDLMDRSNKVELKSSSRKDSSESEEEEESEVEEGSEEDEESIEEEVDLLNLNLTNNHPPSSYAPSSNEIMNDLLTLNFT